MILDDDMDPLLSTMISSLTWTNGWHVKALVNNVPVLFLIDTGAGVSLIDTAIYSMLQKNSYIPELHSFQVPLRTASGESLVSHGALDVNLTIESWSVEHTVVVADLGSRLGILGMDYLGKWDCVLYPSLGRFVLGGQDVTVQQQTSVPCCRVTVEEDVVIPARSGIVVLAQLQQPWPVQRPNIVAVVEPVEIGNLNLVASLTLVDPSKKEVPVWMNNETDYDAVLPTGSLIGIAQPYFVRETMVAPVSETAEEFNGLPDHLQDLITSTEGISADQYRQLFFLLREFKDIFVGPDGELGRTSVARHHIVTTTPQPIRQAPRRLGWARRQIAEDAVDKMLDQGVIELSDSPYSSPIVLIPKKDGTTRFLYRFQIT
uniref:uncharacterized protein LOC120326571 n=1 Tax=Styela clava TaxID=7725 RepID=UPI0019395DD8|nr:uncharacterized protein LOC120326571 [Styela clava]